MYYKYNLKISIAEIIISFDFNYQPFENELKNILKNFIVTTDKIDIDIKLNMVESYETVNGKWDYFITKINKNTMSIKKWDLYGIIKYDTYKATFNIHKDSKNFFLIIKTILLNFLPRFNGLLLHSSSLSNNNYAIIASGISGSGKSTFAKKLSYEGYKIFHDEITIIRYLNSKFYVYSNPFNYNPKHVSNFLPSKELKYLYFLNKTNNYYVKDINIKKFYKKIFKVIFGYSNTNEQNYNFILEILNSLYNKTIIKELSFNINETLKDKIL